jgi:hypothetical protein
MNERTIVLHTHIGGTLTGNHTIADEFPFLVTLRWAKASASNDSSATLVAADEDGNNIITAAVIGDSADMAELTPNAAALAAGYDQVAQDKRIIWTLDYDGSSGTAADDLNFLRGYLVGESA